MWTLSNWDQLGTSGNPLRSERSVLWTLAAAIASSLYVVATSGIWWEYDGTILGNITEIWGYTKSSSSTSCLSSSLGPSGHLGPLQEIPKCDATRSILTLWQAFCQGIVFVNAEMHNPGKSLRSITVYNIFRIVCIINNMYIQHTVCQGFPAMTLMLPDPSIKNKDSQDFQVVHLDVL